MNYYPYEALDRISTMQTMMSCLLCSDSEDWDEGYHLGLSREAKELVGKAMELLCEAYQKQGVYAFSEDK